MHKPLLRKAILTNHSFFFFKFGNLVLKVVGLSCCGYQEQTVDGTAWSLSLQLISPCSLTEWKTRVFHFHAVGKTLTKFNCHLLSIFYFLIVLVFIFPIFCCVYENVQPVRLFQSWISQITKQRIRWWIPNGTGGSGLWQLTQLTCWSWQLGCPPEVSSVF